MSSSRSARRYGSGAWSPPVTVASSSAHEPDRGASVVNDENDRTNRPTFFASLRPWRVTIEGFSSVDEALSALRTEYEEPSIDESRFPGLGPVTQDRWLAAAETPCGTYVLFFYRAVPAWPVWATTKVRMDGELADGPDGSSFVGWVRPSIWPLLGPMPLAAAIIAMGSWIAYLAVSTTADGAARVVGLALAGAFAAIGVLAVRNIRQAACSAGTTLLAPLTRALQGTLIIDTAARPVEPPPPPTITLKRHQELTHSVRLEVFKDRPWIPIAIALTIVAFTVLGLAFRGG